MITATDKDKVLHYLVSEFPDLEGSFYFREISAATALSVPVVEGIIIHFNKLGLIRFTSNKDGNEIAVNISAHDLLSRGGFEVEEEILKENINKLSLELEALAKTLRPDYLEKANKLTSIASQIASALVILTNSK